MVNELPNSSAKSAVRRLKELRGELLESMTVTFHPSGNDAPVLSSDAPLKRCQFRVYEDGIEYLTGIKESEEEEDTGTPTPRTLDVSLYVSGLDILVHYTKRAPIKK